ncbi:hypothetical protein PAT3040_01554 [Paenibacillus agaridevorans]|uniref:DUF2264 domain-containing protein n=1 Tax=Paenibacillus agaridevorans TaxID=171404 RepID=A0A2R5EK60_9BACL|nr:DUF2264 domain-containing protein [Paenibacillus agaridevorans]GBG07006.1 hypothetical protein PAT3040_01554 [Paenibacillus agaridevorans]
MMTEANLGAAHAAERAYWLEKLGQVADPVLNALAERRLKDAMPVECKPGTEKERAQFTHLEALGRLLAGMAPWLEQPGGAEEEAEEKLRLRYAELARAAIDAGTNPESPDFMNFSEGGQPIVDAAFLSQALLRAPEELWRKLDPGVQRNVVAALKATRTRKPGYNNWLLFSALIEAALFAAGESDWDPMRIDYAIRQHEQWYKGDGAYGDGPEFHWDYYNSFVIQPMLIDLLETMRGQDGTWDDIRHAAQRRAIRYAAVQERFIGPDGSFPPIGRSLPYRCGAFHSLAQSALRGELPEELSPESVRCALTAVLRRTLDAPGTFTPEGWLKIGLAGHQREIGESYISTGSLYLCAVAFLPLGLPASHPFWSGPDAPWTSKTVWSGGEIPIDTALKS